MKFVLLLFLTQSNGTELFLEEFKTKKECEIVRKQKLSWNGGLTKIKAFCKRKV